MFPKSILGLFNLTLFLSLFLINANAREDDSNNGSIKGTITTHEGKAAVYVLVQIKQLKKAAYTDEDGSFEINNIKPGTYNVEISLTGYENISKSVMVEQGKAAALDIQLQLSRQQLEAITITTTKRKFGIESSDYIAKMPLSNLENPQVYTTLSKGLLTDQLVFSVDDAMRNAPGIQLMWGATGRSGDGGAYYNSRGFVMQSTLRNGLAGVVTDAIDAANLETVEVLKGPSGTLFGSSLTSYGGLINRVTKKPYDYFGGSVSGSVGGYAFGRGSVDLNTPIDKQSKLLFRFNGAYNYQGSFQTEGFSRRFFLAPSLLYKPTDRLSISLDAEMSYGNNQGNPILFFYYPVSALGVDRADKVNMNYTNSYVGNGLTQQSRSQNYFGQINYKIAKGFTSSTNVTLGRSFSNGRGPYFYLLPDTAITHTLADIGKANFLVRADQSTTNSAKKFFEVQQNFNADFSIAGIRNRVVLGLDYTRMHDNTLFYSTASGFDTVPLNMADYDYSGMNGVSLNNFYNKYFNSSSVYKYPSVSFTNVYSAYISDVINITDQLSVSAAVRVDHFSINNIGSNQKYDQTVFSPKFGAVYQVIKDRISLFANYQNGFRNQNTYIAYRNDSLVSLIAKPEQANQWEAGIKTDFIKGKLSGSLSYYNINVKNILRRDPANLAYAQIQDGAQVSRGVEFQLNANPFSGFNILTGLSYNDSKYDKADASVNGLRPTTASSPWQANWWLSYKLPANVVKGLRVGFGGNYASDNKIINDRAMGVFILPSYVVLNTAVIYEVKNMTLGVKVDNLTNKHYWTGYTTMNPQMLRQLVASLTYKF